MSQCPLVKLSLLVPKSTPSAVGTAGAVPAGEASPPGIAKQSAMTKPELAESSGEAGPFRSRVNGTNSAAAAAAAKSACAECHDET